MRSPTVLEKFYRSVEKRCDETALHGLVIVVSDHLSHCREISSTAASVTIPATHHVVTSKSSGLRTARDARHFYGKHFKKKCWLSAERTREIDLQTDVVEREA